jgi:hypothetical protein
MSPFLSVQCQGEYGYHLERNIVSALELLQINMVEAIWANFQHGSKSIMSITPLEDHKIYAHVQYHLAPLRCSNEQLQIFD